MRLQEERRSKRAEQPRMPVKGRYISLRILVSSRPLLRAAHQCRLEAATTLPDRAGQRRAHSRTLVDFGRRKKLNRRVARSRAIFLRASMQERDATACGTIQLLGLRGQSRAPGGDTGH